ncbi:MAG: hypothetical protein L0Y38_10925 [Methylococcaceae bacterium]|nr:hypothetical protein [Methylococcaceae bacterium]
MTEIHNSSDYQELSDAARNIAKRNLDIQQEVYRITVEALTRGKLESDRIRQVIKTVLEGFQSGVSQNRGQLEETFRKAANGLDEALASAAIATKLAIQEAGSRVGEFTDQEIKKSLHQLENLEGQFLDTLHSLATTGTESSREIFTRLAEHTRQSGTAVGSRSAEALTELGSFIEKFGKMSFDASSEFARVTGTSILQIASGFLSGVADSLKKVEPGKQDHPK